MTNSNFFLSLSRYDIKGMQQYQFEKINFTYEKNRVINGPTKLFITQLTNIHLKFKVQKIIYQYNIILMIILT